MHSHYTTPPFRSLPPAVIDNIFKGLSLLSLHQCGLVRKVWRHLPYTYLYQLSLGEPGNNLPVDLLHRCSNLRSIHVSSSSHSKWLPLAQHISQQQLPSLQEIHIQHSSYSSNTELQQLKQILQVQGPSCHLYLALTDKASLQSLLDLLPIQGLAHLDFNVPYLPEGAADLLAQAVVLQASSSSTQQQCRYAKPMSVGPQQGQLPQPQQQLMQNAHQQVPQQHAFSIGVWVCCWGGCSGLELGAAQNIYQRLRASGCILHGCESINCRSTSDVVQLAGFEGLKALGFNYNKSSGGAGSSGGSIMPWSVQSAAGTAGSGRGRCAMGLTSSSDTSDGSSSRETMWDVNTAALAGLARLLDSLQQLTVHGCPTGGFSGSVIATAAAAGLTNCNNSTHSTLPSVVAFQQQQQQQLPASLHPVAALTGLTKLSLLKQWGPQPSLPISPISLLTRLRELAIERQSLASPFELCCLSVLTGLKVLSLSLVVEAEQLVEEVVKARWQTVNAAVGQAHEHRLTRYPVEPTQQQQQQKEAAEAVGPLGPLAGLTMCEDAVRDACMTDQQLPFGGNRAAVTTAAGMSNSSCSCFCCCCSTAQEPAEPDVNDASTSNKQSTASDPTAGNAATAVAEPAELLRQLSCCNASVVSSAMLLDWSWLSRLTQLEVAWLKVPHLDLACLPDSIIELDAQQPHNFTQVSITCCWATTSNSGGTSSGRFWLPNLRRLVLPRTLPITSIQQQTDSQAAPQAADNDVTLATSGGCSISTAEGFSPKSTPEQHFSAGGAADADDGVTDSEYSWDCGSNSSVSCDMEKSSHCNALIQMHHRAVLLLQLCQGCPELQHLELLQWQLPFEAVMSAAQHFRHLRMISFGRPREPGISKRMQQGLATVRGGSVAVNFQEQLVLSRYPWSSVLAQR